MGGEGANVEERGRVRLLTCGQYDQAKRHGLPSLLRLFELIEPRVGQALVFEKPQSSVPGLVVGSVGAEHTSEKSTYRVSS